MLKRLDRYVDFSFVRGRLKDAYSRIGRPSIDPEILLRMLLVGYLYGITSERRLVEEIRMHLAYRWFTGMGLDEEVPDHSTFSKNRHGRFRDSGIFLEVFEEVVRRCMEVGLVEGQRLTVDGTIIRADASSQSEVERKQLEDYGSRPVKKRSTPRPYRKVSVHWQEAARQAARDLVSTPRQTLVPGANGTGLKRCSSN